MSFFGLFGSRKEESRRPTTTTTNEAPQIRLRSTSPNSDTGSAIQPPRSITPSKSDAGRSAFGTISPRRAIEDKDPKLPPPLPMEGDAMPMDTDIDPADLLALIHSIPPIILHTYVTSHLPSASSAELATLSSFFDTLSPPPRLHCVRCHAGYVEVENTDRSCRVAHDDESAEVGGYETLWGCCGRTTEGDGDLGPPDGWCYEGRHTTDFKRARFRADSMPHNDKLVPCARLGCFGERPSATKRMRSSRTRPRRSYKETSDEENDVDQDDEDDDVVEVIDGDGDEMDVDEDEPRGRGTGKQAEKAKAPASTTGKPRGKGKAGKSVEDAISVSELGSAAGSSKTKGKGKAAAPNSTAGSVAGTVPKAPPKPRAPRKPKSAVALSSAAAAANGMGDASITDGPPPRSVEEPSASARPQSTAAAKKPRARSVSAKPRARKPKVADSAPPPVPPLPSTSTSTANDDAASVGGDSAVSAGTGASRGRTRKVVGLKGKAGAGPTGPGGAGKQLEVEEEEEEAAKPKKKRRTDA